MSDQAIVENSLLSLTNLGTITDPGFDNPNGMSFETFTYSVNWGDGTTTDTGIATIDDLGDSNDLTDASFDGSHTYADNGTYAVTVRVADDDMSGDFSGGTVDVDFAEQTFTVTVGNLNPTANDDTGDLDENGTAITIDVLDNDIDPAGSLDPRTVTGVDSTGTFGTVSFATANVAYEPNGQFE